MQFLKTKAWNGDSLLQVNIVLLGSILNACLTHAPVKELKIV